MTGRLPAAWLGLALAFAAAGCAAIAAQFPGMSARCVAYGMTVTVRQGAARESAGCIETAPAPGRQRDAPR